VAINGVAVAGGPAGRAEPAGGQTRHRPGRHRGEPVRGHEVQRRLRNTRRHHPAFKAHLALESITMDREVMHLRDSLIPGTPADLQRFLVLPGDGPAAGIIDQTQKNVAGWCAWNCTRATARKGPHRITPCTAKTTPPSRTTRFTASGRRRVHPSQRPAAPDRALLKTHAPEINGQGNGS
jgi:hypothetical protein